MLKVEKIMVPVDFSAASSEAVRYGTSLALEFDAALLLCHVVPFLEPMAHAYRSETNATLAEQVREQLEAQVSPEFRDAVHRKFVMTSGDARSELLSIVVDETPDLVIMGTHGQRTFERWILGSVAEHLLRHSPVPLLTVSQPDRAQELTNPHSIPLKRLLYATDLSDSSGRALQIAFDAAHRFRAELIVLHVMRPIDLAFGIESVSLDLETTTTRVRDATLRELESSLPKSMQDDARVRTVLLDGTPYEEILRVADERKADLIVLNTQSKTGIERALVGATAERVVRGAHIPVLSVPPAEHPV